MITSMPSDADVLKDAQRVADIVNAVAAAKDGDRRKEAVSLLVIAEVLLCDDDAGKIAFAQLMAEVMSRLLSSVGNEYAVTVRRLN
jgi:hypothetical protein